MNFADIMCVYIIWLVNAILTEALLMYTSPRFCRAY